MNTATQPQIEIPATLGVQTELGLYFANIRVGDNLIALFQPPKAIAFKESEPWNGSFDNVEDAYSFSDGYANTVAMARAGSKLAQWALDNGMHIPALDESDLQYRFFKPTTAENRCYMRSGINLSAETPLQPYTPDFPKQTELDAYREGGAEAFDPVWHWTSTQSRDWRTNAWAQYFDDGTQDACYEDYEFAVRPVRRSIIR